MSADRPYFPYIDGLRAVSILAVVLFHLEPAALPGGFGGVDIFFVVSGFIVSGSLHGYRPENFRSLVGLFYARRFRRIVPALLFMLALTSILFTAFVPQSFNSDDARRTALAAFFGVSNFHLAGGVGYFSPVAEFNAFTHTWSLGVEEQFYLIFPALFFLLTRSERLARASTFGLAALCALSFAYGVVEPFTKWSFGFYSSFARFWEIGTGVLLYAVLAQRGLFDARGAPKSEIVLATYLGSVLIAAGLVLGRAASYPVPGALLPVAGALLVIAALQGRKPQSWIGRLLSTRPAVAIGLISYSLYLWHWPVFVLFRWTVGFSTIGQKLAALAIAVALSLVSYALVERPLRNTAWLRAPARAIPIALAAIVLLAWGADRVFANARTFSASIVMAERRDWYPIVDQGRSGTCRTDWQQWPFLGVSAYRTRRIDCSEGEADRRLFVIGDSHALAYRPMLTDFAQTTRTPVFLYQAPGCNFISAMPSDPRCTETVAATVAEVKQQLKPGDVVFMSSLRVPRFRDPWTDRDYDTAAIWRVAMANADAALTEGLSALRQFEAQGAHLVFELPPPIFRTPLFRCSDWFNRMNPGCDAGTTMERDFLLQYRQPTVTLAETLGRGLTNFSTWDPLPVLCPGTTCAMLKDGKPLFYDGDHLSGFANRLLLDDFRRKMEQAGKAQQSQGGLR